MGVTLGRAVHVGVVVGVVSEGVTLGGALAERAVSKRSEEHTF